MTDEVVSFSPLPYRRTLAAVKFIAPLLALVALWQAVVSFFAVDPRVFPSVPMVLRAGWSTIVDGTLVAHVGASLWRVTVGTVIAILQTFSAITPGSRPEPSEIIRNYAPAITATGGGLYMAFINILPSWVANVGRDLIRALGGYAPPPESSATPGGTP